MATTNGKEKVAVATLEPVSNGNGNGHANGKEKVAVATLEPVSNGNGNGHGERHRKGGRRDP